MDETGTLSMKLALASAAAAAKETMLPRCDAENLDSSGSTADVAVAVTAAFADENEFILIDANRSTLSILCAAKLIDRQSPELLEQASRFALFL
jgi:hypothetical protein